MKKSQWVKSIKFLCFDVDGTLYRDVPAVWELIQTKIYDEVMKKKRWDLERTKKEFSERYERLGSSTKVLDELGIDGQEFFTNVFEDVDLSGVIRKDIQLRDLIERLRKQYAVGIVSNGTTTSIMKKLEAVGLSTEQFSPFIATYDINAPKPDPAGFLMALEHAGVSPEESVYIGDKEETDILGAKGVGMHAVMVWGESKEADLSIPTIYDLESLFLENPEEIYIHKKPI